MSPYEYTETVERKQYGIALETRKVGNYYYYSYFCNKNEFLEKDYKKEDSIIIISSELWDIVDFFEKENYKKYRYNNLYIFVNQSSKLEIEEIIF